jgi:rhodanese-related sulfurtransferase
MLNTSKAAVVLTLMVFTFGCAPQKTVGEVPGELPATGLFRMMQTEKVLLINTTSDMECMDQRIPGSICLPCGDVAAGLGKVARDKDAPIVFYCENGSCYRSCPAAEEARKRGYQRVYTLKGGLLAWKEAGYVTESPDRIPRQPVYSIQPARVNQWLGEGRKMVILDVRSKELFDQGHIQGALSIPMNELHRRYAEIPQDLMILVVDQSGFQSFLAASYLVRKGFGDVERLSGGVDRWTPLTAAKGSKGKS